MPTPEEMSDGYDLFIECAADWVTEQVRPTSIRDMLGQLRVDLQDATASDAHGHARRAYALYLLEQLEKYLRHIHGDGIIDWSNSPSVTGRTTATSSADQS